MKLKNPVNIILVAVSFLIFGSLGTIFITQMELLPGYNWDDIQNKYPVEIDIQLTGDLSGDGIPDIISNAYTRSMDPEDLSRIAFPIPNIGGIFAINSLDGTLVWSQLYETPVREIMPIGDFNSDGYEDYLANMMTVESEWNITLEDWDDEQNVPVHNPKLHPDRYVNKLVSGVDGAILSGNISNNLVLDTIRVSNLGDYIEDFIMLEGKYDSINENYKMNISTYFSNGTRTMTIDTNRTFHGSFNTDINIPTLRQFPYNGENHALFVDYDSLILFNTSIYNLMDPIFIGNVTLIQNSAIIEDLNLDGIPEIITSTEFGNITLHNGMDGSILHHFMLPESYHTIEITEVGNTVDDQSTYVLFYIDDYENSEIYAYVYDISVSDQTIAWEYYYNYGDQEDGPKIFHLGEDMTGDGINELILAFRYQPAIQISGDVRRFIFVDPITDEELGIINSDRWIREPISIPDFDGDGKRDLAFEDGLNVYAIASQKPIAIWLSPLFGIGIPLVVLLASLLILGIIILIINGKKIKPKRNRLQQSKLAVVVNIIAITLMTVSFLLFLLQLNVFNRTLISGDPMTGITTVYLSISIIWYGLLPLTAAIFNQFSARFAYGIVGLRSLFFKFSRSYKHAIFVEDLSGRMKLSTTIRLKRVILPMLLSISIGFYSYNSFAPLFGYPQGFDTFGGQDFFSFMIGYNLICILPMLLTFIAFSFFFSGNYLLDDAGVAYYLESKKHRKPGDIEPISIWSQSIVSGIAGFSAIITFISFFQTVDFSGFFTETGGSAVFMFIFGIFFVVVMFYGTPFLTAFSYILFSVEVMDFSLDNNTSKLYKIMEKNGYDTTPRKLTNLFPSGFEELRKIPKSEKEE